ncbi:NaeI family type II restriction endonuclease [Streptomyces sp. NRRL WC-3742]|uniref:NaeI family type II restriction endonuclease n=1 Tax=Streptomyces sp. NRRL WC-3742 TaxID=1463934 RepID=UPI0004C9647A|nr:NaeI family type II restriction endonuclease [Streptomyces sp. NRRL WC-3742]
MASERIRSGRRQAPPLGACPSMDLLVHHLRDLRDSAGLNVAELRVRLVEAMRDEPADPPAEQTLHRLLRGTNLHAKPRLAEAVADVCVHATRGDRQAARERVREFYALAREEMAGSRGGTDPEPKGDQANAEIKRLRTELQKKQQENLHLAAEVAATRRLLAALAPGGDGGAVTGDDVLGEILERIQYISASSDEALAEAQAARAETAWLRDWVTASAWDQEPETSAPDEADGAEPAFETPNAEDPELEELVRELTRRDPTGARMAGVIESAGEYLLDGGRTGRYELAQLSAAEKLVFSSTVERLMQGEFGLTEGTAHLDLALNGIEFDLRWTLGGTWAFWPELVGELCVVAQANERTGKYSYGVVRVRPEYLRQSVNRGGRSALTRQGREAIRWIRLDGNLRTGVLRQLSEDDREAVLGQRTGAQRLTELFRRAQGKRLTRGDLATVCRTPDPLRRLREALPVLRREGILVAAGHLGDRSVLTALGAPEPAAGEWVGLRLVPADGEPGPVIDLDGTPWRKARPEDPETPLP